MLRSSQHPSEVLLARRTGESKAQQLTFALLRLC